MEKIYDSEHRKIESKDDLKKLVSNLQKMVHMTVVEHLLSYTVTLNSENYSEPVVVFDNSRNDLISYTAFHGKSEIRINLDLFEKYLIGVPQEQHYLAYLCAIAHEHGHHLLYMLGLQWGVHFADREDFSDFISGLIIKFLFKKNNLPETNLKVEDFQVIYRFVKEISFDHVDPSHRSAKGHGNPLVRQTNFFDGFKEDLVTLSRFKFLLKLLTNQVDKHLVG